MQDTEYTDMTVELDVSKIKISVFCDEVQPQEVVYYVIKG
jgi:hypothetical protein